MLKPGRPGLQEKSWPIDAFFHKIVMLRNRLRTLEQQVNASDLPGGSEDQAAGVRDGLLRHAHQLQRPLRRRGRSLHRLGTGLSEDRRWRRREFMSRLTLCSLGMALFIAAAMAQQTAPPHPRRHRHDAGQETKSACHGTPRHQAWLTPSRALPQTAHRPGLVRHELNRRFHPARGQSGRAWLARFDSGPARPGRCFPSMIPNGRSG